MLNTTDNFCIWGVKIVKDKIEKIITKLCKFKYYILALIVVKQTFVKGE